jgi:hypothetical protein
MKNAITICSLVVIGLVVAIGNLMAEEPPDRAPVIIDATGVEKGDRQNVYPGVTFTKEGMAAVLAYPE